MATTTQILRLQSDQILDGPTIGSLVNLKNLTDTRRLQLIWVQPAVDPSTLLFRDPGGLGDAVVYEKLAQTVKNKTLDNTNTLPDQAQYLHLAGQTGGQIAAGGTGNSENLTLRSTTAITKGTVQIDQDDLTMGATHNILFSAGGEPKGLPTTPSGSTSAASKAYVDSQISIITGGAGVWKEELLSATQLDSGNKAIAQATVIYLNATPVNGDQIRLTDGASNEIYTFGPISGAFTPVPGGSPFNAMTSLAAHINSDSTTWFATLYTTLQGINPTGNAIVIKRKVPTAVVLDRVFAITGTAGIAKYVNYTAALDYRSSVVISLPTTDPGTGNFGLSRITSALIPDETHIVRAEDSAYLWNDDAGTWQLSAGAIASATSGAGGGSLGQATFDENFGLTVVPAGIARVKVDATTIAFNGGGQLTVAGGAVPLGTSAPLAAGTPGKVSGDESSGIQITGAGAVQAKVDGTTMVFDGLGNLKSTPVALNPIGTVSFAALLTQNITSPITVGGTASVANLNAAVSGSGTTWLTSLYNGASIQFSNQIGTFYTILSVNSNISITLSSPFTGATNGSVTVSYAVGAPVSGVVATDIPTQRYQDSVVQGQFFDFVVPDDYDNGPINILAAYQMSAAQANNVRYRTQAKIVKGNATVDTTTFPWTAATLSPPNSTNFTRSTLLAITGGTFSKGDTIQFYFARAGNATLDTHTGEMVVVAFEVSYTGQVSTRAATQTADVFGLVTGFPSPTAGSFNTDIPTINFSNSVDQATAAYFIVPDTWDGVSDAYVRVQYALASASAGNIDLKTSGNIADVVAGTATAIPSVDGIFAVTADTNPHRSQIIRQIPASLLSKGSFIELAIQRFTATPGNSTAVIQILNVTVTFAVVPVSGFASQTTSLMSGGVFGNISGTVTADVDYPNLAGGEVQGLFDMSSTTAAGRVDVAWSGVLSPAQTQVTQISVPLKGTGTSPQYHIQVYVDGTIGPVYDSGLQAAPATVSPPITIFGPSLSAQPTGDKHFAVVVQAFIDAGEAILVGRPTVTQQ
jgi:hypothetical protein